MALDSSDHPHIAYFEYINEDLRYAYFDGSSWHTETVDSEDRVGMYASLVLDDEDHPHVYYYDNTNDCLKYAYNDGTAWHTEVVDNDGDVGWKTSIDLDSSGIPHISYGIAFNQDLKYAYTPGPSSIILECEIAGNVLILSWNPMGDASEYWVYGAADMPFFCPGLAPAYENRLTIVNPPTLTWSTHDAVGNPAENWFYLVMAVDEIEQELAQSNRVGELDF